MYIHVGVVYQQPIVLPPTTKCPVLYRSFAMSGYNNAGKEFHQKRESIRTLQIAVWIPVYGIYCIHSVCVVWSCSSIHVLLVCCVAQVGIAGCTMWEETMMQARYPQNGESCEVHGFFFCLFDLFHTVRFNLWMTSKPSNHCDFKVHLASCTCFKHMPTCWLQKIL